MGSHVTPLGFKNDGYDYEQHLKVGGGGHFIASDGTVSLAPTQEIVELPEHKWYLGVQFHPELSSQPLKPHPIFNSFIKASLNNKKHATK